MPNLSDDHQHIDGKAAKHTKEDAPFTDFYDKAAEFMEQKYKHEEMNFFNQQPPRAGQMVSRACGNLTTRKKAGGGLYAH